MGVDICVMRARKKYCPHCGAEIEKETVGEENSGGRVWYEWLEKIGYYVPYEKRTEENDWYGKDMTLTAEQAEGLYQFIGIYKPYNADGIAGLIARAGIEENDVIINADW